MNYSKQFRDDVLATRNQILEQEDRAEALLDTAIVARSHASNGLADSRDRLAELTEEFGLAKKIWDQSMRSQLLAANVAARASDAATESAAATAQISTAADAIKDANQALETLTCDLGCILAVTGQKFDGADATAPPSIYSRAEAAQQATSKAANSAEQLMFDSLEASVEATRSTAAALATAIEGLEDDFDTVAAEGAATLAASEAAVDAARKVYASSEKGDETSVETLVENDKNEASLANAIERIDALINNSLRGTTAIDWGDIDLSSVWADLHNVLHDIDDGDISKAIGDFKQALSDSESAIKAALETVTLRATLNLAEPGLYSEVTFAAVPLAKASVFGYSDFESLDSPRAVTVEGADFKTPDSTMGSNVATADKVATADLRFDATTGDPLLLGEEYIIFAFKMPIDPKTQKEDLNRFLSFPSQSVLLQLDLPLLLGNGPTAAVTGAESFTLSLPTGTALALDIFADYVNGFLPEKAHVSFQLRAIIVLEQTYKENAKNELFLASLLDPAYYTQWKNPDLPLLFSPTGQEATGGLQKISSPTGTSGASYTDMYGNFIDLADAKYVALVLAVGIDNTLNTASKAVKGVLSPPSNPIVPGTPDKGSAAKKTDKQEKPGKED